MRFALAVLFLFTATSTFCADESKSLAMRKGAEVCVVLRVVDEQGNAVPDAGVYGGFAMGGGLNDGVTISGKTDRDGRFVVKGRCKLFVNLTVFKEGFYSWHDKFDYAATSLNPAVKDGKWQPYGETVVVTLKKKINPVEMPGVYGRGDISIPVMGEWLSFDIERGQWLPPYGSGVSDDVLLRFTHQVRTSKYFDFKSTMEVSFTNNLYAGGYVVKKDPHSELVTAYEADTNRVYSSCFSYVFDCNRSRKGENIRQLERDEVLVFRTRTKVDEKGRLVSASYGKIEGPWSFSKGMSADKICINPVPNNTSIEDKDCARRSDLGVRRLYETIRQKSQP